MSLMKIMKEIPDADSARAYLENLRWKDGVICPHCGTIDNHYQIKPKADSVAPARKGVYKCKDCRKQFTVTVGTIFEKSHVPLNKWVYAIYLLCSSKKGFSALQLSRSLDITYKSAWFMAHRIRHAMTHTGIFTKMDGIVEADETYVGGKSKGKAHTGRGTEKAAVVALVERNGRVRSRHVDRVTSANLKGIIRESVETTAVIMTDEFRPYKGLNKEFVRHEVINHTRKEYVRGDVHTNTIEGYFSILKRGINGIYQHVGKPHLGKYLAEYDFRYNTRDINDMARTEAAILSGEGKRLTYN